LRPGGLGLRGYLHVKVARLRADLLVLLASATEQARDDEADGGDAGAQARAHETLDQQTRQASV
jgi:hypothetical protein